MGQMIKITYVGAFIVPRVENWQEVKSTDEFCDKFYESEKFRTAYQGLEEIDVLIPCGNKYALKDQEDYHDEFIVIDFDELTQLRNIFNYEYKDQIDLLMETFPEGRFDVRAGVVSYWDEIA